MYKIVKTVCTTFKVPECQEGDEAKALEWAENTLLPDVEKEYKDIPDIQRIATKSVNACLVSLEMDICSNCLEDGCDTYGKDGAKFFCPDAYNGFLWKLCDCEGFEEMPIDPDNPDAGTCLVYVEEEPDDCLCGIKFTGGFLDPEILACSWAIDDQIEREPVEVEVSIIRQYQDGDAQICDPMIVDWTVVQYGTTRQGDGRFVARKEILSREYDLYSYVNPKHEMGALWQQRLGYEYGFEPQKFYNHITLYHNYSRAGFGQSLASAAHNTNREMITLYVDKDNVKFMEDLKSFFNKTLLSHGVCNLLK